MNNIGPFLQMGPGGLRSEGIFCYNFFHSFRVFCKFALIRLIDTDVRPQSKNISQVRIPYFLQQCTVVSFSFSSNDEQYGFIFQLPKTVFLCIKNLWQINSSDPDFGSSYLAIVFCFFFWDSKFCFPWIFDKMLFLSKTKFHVLFTIYIHF